MLNLHTNPLHFTTVDFGIYTFGSGNDGNGGGDGGGWMMMVLCCGNSRIDAQKCTHTLFRSASSQIWNRSVYKITLWTGISFVSVYWSICLYSYLHLVFMHDHHRHHHHQHRYCLHCCHHHQHRNKLFIYTDKYVLEMHGNRFVLGVDVDKTWIFRAIYRCLKSAIFIYVFDSFHAVRIFAHLMIV